MTEDKKVGWLHRLYRHEFEQAPGVDDGQGGLTGFGPKKSDKESERSGRSFQVSAAAKSLQSCPNLCDPIDSSPPGSSVHGILQARTLEWVAISFSNA